MGPLQILLAVVVFVTLFRGTSSCYGYKCGCIYVDNSKIDEKDLICEPLRTSEFHYFQNGLKIALKKNWQAFRYFKSFKAGSSPEIPDVGRSLCKTEKKDILGFWKKGGSILCWIVAPDIYKAECCGETCCGADTRCEPTLHLDRKYLIYCDNYYAGGIQPGINGLIEPDADEFSEEALELISQSDEAGSGDGESTRRKRSTYKYGYGLGYFAFRHDRFPLICTCRTCDW
ncbi:uncharacterized protein LOC110447095 [Mizuhopecten yessoensis]|uniref:Uncharacterized protein n=1 Tax=Mizuhopecten yessoensis TaxID=6573 RepID=A0A210QVS5_MIZYE|nr:uncharacterized protein LOC110447095 [Mizuhopecten yessoensis]OWF52863.1 hypothetical protein KP79_PYT12855 [Mizuhopecten yessoensis]